MIYIPGFVTVSCTNCGETVHSISMNIYEITPQKVQDELQNLELYWDIYENKLFCSSYCIEGYKLVRRTNS